MIILPAPIEVQTDQADKQVSAWVKQSTKQLEMEGSVTIDTRSATVGIESLTDKLGKAQKMIGALNGFIDAGQSVLADYPELFGNISAETTKTVDTLQAGAVQMASWAATGASLGSIIPGIGTGIGAAAGAAASAAKSTYDWWYETNEVKETQEDILEIERQRRKEQKAEEEYWAKLAKGAEDYEARFGAAAIAKEVVKLGDEYDKIPPKIRTAKEAVDEVAEAQAKWNRLIEELGEKPQIKEVITSLGRVKTAYDLALNSRSDTPTAENAPELFGPSSLPEVELPMFDIDAHEENLKALEAVHNESVAKYEGHVSKLTSITGELYGQIEKNAASGKSLFSGLGAAAEKGVSQVLKALGKEWSVKAIGHFAEGLALLASPIPGARGLAAIEFGAAAQFGAAAVAAGVGGAVMAGNAQRRSSEGGDTGGSGSGGGVTGGGSSRLADPGPTVHPTINVYFGGAPGSTTIHAGTGEDGAIKAGQWVLDTLDAHQNSGPSLKKRG